MTADDVLVVIGAGGMGLSVARRIGAGRIIVLADINGELLATAAGVLKDDGHRVETAEVDVSSRSSVAAVAEFAASVGRVTNVVHTAGLSPEQASVAAILAVDLLGVALVLEEFEGVIAPGGAAVVIASMAGHVHPSIEATVEEQLATTPADELLSLEICEADRFTSQSAYGFAKRANIVRVAGAAANWGSRGARVNSISPGIIATGMGKGELAGESGEFVRMMIDSSPCGRIGTPEDIAATTEFLLGASAAFITGTDLLVDGGVAAALRNGGFDLPHDG
jgi:NAD(P)-dependent dehydrogenase (short-subunit alcohol dehydrogenase family)